MAEGAQQSSAAKHEAAWWAEWRRKDFSWAGLNNDAWDGWVVTPDGFVAEAASGRVYGQPAPTEPSPVAGRDATLQDYWRADPATGLWRADAAMAAADELVVRADADNETYHRCHLPLAYADGTPTGKADWPDNALDPLIAARLRAAFDNGPAQFQGGIWPSFDAKRILAEDKPVVSIDVSGAAFTGEASFWGVQFTGEARFFFTQFAGAASFDYAQFTGGAGFVRAQFTGDARFSDARFAGAAVFVDAQFTDKAWFDDAQFAGEALFWGAQFTGKASFSGAQFAGDTKFNNAQFAGEALFRGAQFAGDTKFNNAQFAGEALFRGAQFAGPSYFEEVKFAPQLAYFGNAFTGTRFKDVADFTGAGTHWIAAFNGVIFEQPVRVPRPSERYANREFEEFVLKAVDAAVAADAKDDTKKAVDALRTARLQQIEGGCRALKNALGRDRDEILEQRYYRFQLIARRKQTGVPWTEKLFSLLYDWTSRYGASIGRPFAALLFLVLMFAVGFFAAKYGIVQIAQRLAEGDASRLYKDAAEALTFSASRVFPFGAFEDVSAKWISEFNPDAPLATLAVRVFASVESGIALALVFVFGLAVRRKFQIS
jgi:hypothetical protein